MNYDERWGVIEKLGSGGQGTVYRVTKTTVNNDVILMDTIFGLVHDARINFKVRESLFGQFKKIITDFIDENDQNKNYALKVLNNMDSAKDSGTAYERIKKEIKAMAEIKHKHIIQIIDRDPEAKWFVSKYYPKGTLDKHRERFAGNVIKSLYSFRTLVGAVSVLHEKRIVHRDIKPENVFVDENDDLVLGDFGIVLFLDDKHTRLSGELENVGSRDWMPLWAQGELIENLTPAFDVFSLGKLLWSMVSGKPKLRLWYFDKEQFNVENIFPKERFVRLINPLLKKCIVEFEHDCLPNATALLEEIDKYLKIIENNAEIINLNSEWSCKVCGLGKYTLTIDENNSALRNFGINPVGSRIWKIFICNNCGNVQFFTHSGNPPKAWS